VTYLFKNTGVKKSNSGDLNDQPFGSKTKRIIMKGKQLQLKKTVTSQPTLSCKL